MATNGLVVVAPTSIAHSNGSASISSDGSVSFSSVSSLSLNGVFTSDYESYMIVTHYKGSSFLNAYMRMRLRTTSDDSGSNYQNQEFAASHTTRIATRTQDSYFGLGQASTQGRSAHTIYLFKPNLATVTSMRSVTTSDISDAYMDEWASHNSTSTQYTGATLIMNAGTISGRVTVFGFNQ